jgi:hypothetical protein
MRKESGKSVTENPVAPFFPPLCAIAKLGVPDLIGFCSDGDSTEAPTWCLFPIIPSVRNSSCA